MSWRYRWSLFHIACNTQILRTRSLCHFSSYFYVSDKTYKIFSGENGKFILTPQIVHSTLLNLSSDLIALSFFIWCAKQHNYFHNHQAFDHMVSVVARLNDHCLTVRAIVKELESVGLAIKAQTFLLLLRIYWHGGMYSMVFETFDEMGCFGFEPNTFAHNVIMDVLFKIGLVDAGLKVLEELKSPNFLSYSIALSNLCKCNDLVNAKNVLQMMLIEGYYPNLETFDMVLNCFCKLGRLEEAYQLLGLMISLGFSFSVNTWNILIDGFCRLQRPDMAFCFFERMIRSGCCPSVVTYTSLFKGLMESRMISSAFRILTIMQSEGSAPDLFLCNVLINSLSKIRRYDDAIDIFLCLPNWKLVPDSYTFSSLISSLCNSRRFHLLPKLIGGIVMEADLVLCNSLLNYFCKAGFPHLAVELYDEMIDNSIVPDNYSLVGLLRGLCGERRVYDAVNVYQGILMSYTSPDAHVHSVIIDELIKSGRCHLATRLFRRAIVEKYQLDLVSYTIAISGLIKKGWIAEATSLYTLMREVGLYPNAYIYSVMICHFCTERDVKMVKTLLQEVTKAGVQLDYNTFVRLADFLFLSSLSSSLLEQFVSFWNLGLMPDEAIDMLVFGCLNRKFGDANHSLVKGYVETGSSSSDDLPDVAASLG